MKILVATNHLNRFGGTESFTYTIIEELSNLGYDIEYFTLRKGVISDKIENDLSVNFMSKNRYDIILANHNTIVEKLHTKGFIIQTCHGIFPNLEQPHDKADAYVAISYEVQKHLALLGKPSLVIHNSINLNRFKPEKKINNKLNSVLSLCHKDEANRFIQNICTKLNLEFNSLDKYDKPVWEVENHINNSDLVVGLGRSAYEAMACGRPVIVYDNRQYFESCGDGYVKNQLGFSLRYNCSGRYSKKKFSELDFINELKKYDENDSAYFRHIAEQEFDVSKNILKYLLYAEKLKKLKKSKIRKNKIKLMKKVIGKRGFEFLARLKNKL